MPAKIDGMKPPFIPIGGLEGISSRKPVAPSPGDADFHQILMEKIEEEQNLKFSAHARSRLQSRNIEVSSESLSKLGKAVDQANQKGAHESLILIEDAAFVVNIDNRTVITAMDEGRLQENVFTNIDSAVIVK